MPGGNIPDAGEGVGPTNITLPVVSGTLTVGQTLSSTPGSWDGRGALSYAYQWLRNGSQIAGATASTYLLTSLDKLSEITCEATASDSQGSAAAISLPTGWVGNLLLAPNDFSNAAWNFLLATHENDGLSNQLMREAVGTGTHRVRQQISKATSSQAYRAQFDVRAGLNCNWLRVACEDGAGANGVAANYDAQNATVGASYSTGAGFAVTRSTLSALAGGAYRVVLEFTTNADAGLRFAVQMSRPNQDTINYAGDVNSALYIRNFVLGLL